MVHLAQPSSRAVSWKCKLPLPLAYDGIILWRNLRKKGIAIVILAVTFLPGCVSSSYRVIDMDRYRTELEVTPDRIFLECEDIKDHENAGDPEGNFGFMMHVLDEANTVVTLIQEPVTSRKFCFERLKTIDQILKRGKSIYIGAHGFIEEVREKGARSYMFRERGPFYGNGRSLQLSVIKNEHNQCYTAMSAADAPCMPPEFPIKNSPRR